MDTRTADSRGCPLRLLPAHFRRATQLTSMLISVYRAPACLILRRWLWLARFQTNVLRQR